MEYRVGVDTVRKWPVLKFAEEYVEACDDAEERRKLVEKEIAKSRQKFGGRRR